MTFFKFFPRQLRPFCMTAFLFLLTVGLAQAEALDEESTTEEASQATTPERPIIQDEVFVDGVRPDIPTSNSVAAKLPLSLRETPASVGVVDAALIEEQDGFSLGDALKNVAGLNVQPGSGTFDFYVVRGIDSLTSGLILTDGAPEPETTAYPLYNIERVEVLKGPASFLYGGGPMGSTVNMVRKQPRGGDTFGSFSLEGGSFGTLETRVDANVANDAGTLAFRFNGLYQESDNFRDAKESDNLAINPSLLWRPSERTSVHFNLERMELDYISDSGLPLIFVPTGTPGDFDLAIPDVRRENNYQSPFDVSEQEVDRFQVDVETQLSATRRIRNKTYYRRLDWFTRAAVFNGVFPNAVGSLEVSRTLTQLDNTQEFTGNQFEFLGRFTTGSIEHNLLAGVEIARRDDVFALDVGLLPGIDLFQPVETAAGEPFFLPGFGFAADTKTDIVAPYVVDQITLSEKFQLLVGARYDQIDFEDIRNGIRRDDDEVSPMLGFVVLPTETLSLYANYGEGFAPPSSFTVGSQPEPETSDQIEVGLRKNAFAGRLQFSAAVFRIDRQNIAIPDSATGFLQQTGDQRAEGVELELSADFVTGLRIVASYAYTDSELTEFNESLQIGRISSSSLAPATLRPSPPSICSTSG